jgi:hypothetical protein
MAGGSTASNADAGVSELLLLFRKRRKARSLHFVVEMLVLRLQIHEEQNRCDDACYHDQGADIRGMTHEI